MAAKKKRTVNYERIAEQAIEGRVAEIDEALEEIEERLQKYQPLIDARNKLNAAKRALLGGNALTGAGGTRIRREDVKLFLEQNPGSTLSELVEHFDVAVSTVSSHLYRGRDEYFLEKNKRWYVRDPEDGYNTVDDIPDEEDDDE